MDDILVELKNKGSYELVVQTPSKSQWRLLGRVPAGAKDRWKRLRVHLLKTAETPACCWQVDISQQFFLRDGSEVYGWRLIFHAKNKAPLDTCLTHLLATLRALPGEERGEVMLVVRDDRNNVHNPLHPGKGAQPMNSALVGQAAHHAFRGR